MPSFSSFFNVYYRLYIVIIVLIAFLKYHLDFSRHILLNQVKLIHARLINFSLVNIKMP